MFQQVTTILILTTITVQAVFGGLQNSVSICLGGGHEHEVAAVIEHCELECSHHSDWVTPRANEEHLGNCECTDLEFGLIVLLTTPRGHDASVMFALAPFTFKAFVDLSTSQSWRGPPQSNDDDIGMMHRITVIRTTRLRV